MKTQTDWNGLTLKVTSPATAKPLINDAFAASLIAQAGGAVNFVDVMLSAEQRAA